MKIIRVFLSENFQFLEVKFFIYLNRRVFGNEADLNLCCSHMSEGTFSTLRLISWASIHTLAVSAINIKILFMKILVANIDLCRSIALLHNSSQRTTKPAIRLVWPAKRKDSDQPVHLVSILHKSIAVADGLRTACYRFISGPLSAHQGRWLADCGPLQIYKDC